MRWGETIGLEHAFLLPDAIHVEWQLREINGIFYRIPPKDDSYRSPNWEPGLPVDLPPFLISLLARQAEQTAGLRCACAQAHGGTGRYLFTGPDGGHYRRSNYARRIFRPACDGRYPSASGRPARLVIADTTTLPGLPVAAWPTANPASPSWEPPCGRGIPVIPDGIPLSCWLPIKSGLAPHGLRHSHKTWMEVSNVASGASFNDLCEHALPAAQRAPLTRTQRDGAWRNAPDLGRQQPVASGLRTMQPVRLHRTPA
jgi:hypothetical protein